MDQQQQQQYPFGKSILTTDALVFRQHEGKQQVLLITRGRGAHIGRYGFPGGKVDFNEDPRLGCLRELREETGVEGISAQVHDVRGEPGRDPRGHFVTIVYRVQVNPDSVPKAMDDASAAEWLNVEDVLAKGPEAFAFDHFDILNSAVK